MCGRRKIYRTAEELRLAKNASSRDSHRIARHENWAYEHPEPSRTTLNSAPTPDQLLQAFNHRNDSPADMIRLGSLLEDIEALFGVGYERKVQALCVGEFLLQFFLVFADAYF